MFAARPKSTSAAPSRDSYTRRAVSAELVAELYEILDATMLLMDSEQGNIQVYDPVRNVLEIVAHRGLPEEFLSALRTVSREDETASARAAQSAGPDPQCGADIPDEAIRRTGRAVGQEEDQRRTRDAGFDDHLVKPVDPMALIKVVAEAKRP